ncbi:MAG: thioredoxin family protein [Bacteroidetes bacterium]|jgi:thioredoxin-related protein|nr:thioredoxin family protein [Bacteroidota bacterium]
MKYLFLVLLSFVMASNAKAQHWGHDYAQAIDTAKKEQKFILVNFSGSDWCGPCIRLHKEVFTTEVFLKVAKEKLVLLNADFPRYKKNQLPAAQQKINESLAEQFNNKGIFPLTVLVSTQGKVIRSWEGFPSSIDAFNEDLQQTIQDNQ